MNFVKIPSFCVKHIRRVESKMKKELKDMTLEELWELFPIVLVPHSPLWKELAKDEIERISLLLLDFDPRISHIGSTAIPNIYAKPIVDILVEMPDGSDWNRARQILESSGYICMSVSENRMSFNKGYTPEGYAEKVYHVHLHPYGDNDEIFFRDYLIAHPDAAKEYEALKVSLLPQYQHNRDGYTEAKTQFVKDITARRRNS